MFCSESCEESYIETCLDHQSVTELSSIADSKGDRNIERLAKALNIFMRVLKHFGSVSAMKSFYDGNADNKPTVFDFDWSDSKNIPSFSDIFNMILGTATEDLSSDEFLEDIKSITTWILNKLDSNNALKRIILQNLAEHKEFMETVLRKFYGISDVMKSLGSVMIDKKYEFSWYFHPTMLLLNHSCDPNIVFHVMNNGKIALVVCRPIPIDGQIFTNYTPEYYAYYTRSNHCRFQDTCAPCKEHWRNSISLEKIKKQIPVWTSSVQMDHLQYLKVQVYNYREICDDINFIFPGDSSKPPNHMKAATSLCLFKFYLQVMECPFTTIKAADYIANMKRNTKNYD